ncbi:MAG: TIGR04283 family arsenosugar biosynthesis glycosyltransferase [Sphingomonadales bacterium]
MLSVIIPALNEQHSLPRCLAPLQPMRGRGVEVIVVDGGSDDGTASMGAVLADRVMAAPRGRAAQMNAGAAAATGDVLLFLHADTLLPEQADRLVAGALARSGRDWGRFDVRIDGRPWMLRVVALAMNWRSRLSGIATGDQALFVRRQQFSDIGGFPAQPLMEDIEISKRLRARGRPVCLHAKVTTSGRRWEQRGVWRTILLMWRLRWAYARGVPADELARAYR